MKSFGSALLALFALGILFPADVSSQTYFIDTTIVLPAEIYRGNITPLSLSIAREDVKAIGMGRTQIGLNRRGPSMLANPAFLATSKTTLDLLNVKVGIPGQTLSATGFIEDNVVQFQQGIFLKEIRAGIVDFDNAVTPEQALAAIRRMNNGLQFITDMVTDVSGGEENPMTHGVHVLPAFQAQVGHFGFSLSATAQSGFQVSSGRALEALNGFKIPEDLTDVNALAASIQSLFLAIDGLFDEDGEVALDALPSVYALSYLDIVGTAGYGMRLSNNIDAGVNLKIINRRFSTSRIPATSLEDLISETRTNFEASVTGFTFDAGIIYTLPSARTRIAATAENILPVKTILSDMKVRIVESFPIYARDFYPDGPIKTVGADTGLALIRLPLEVQIPFELKAPLILSAGVSHQLASNWDAALEWNDIATQSSLYETTLQRIRLGTEYRFKPIPGILDAAARLGFAQDHMTYGIGLDLFKVVEIDGAVAFDRFTAATSYFAQLRLGW